MICWKNDVINIVNLTDYYCKTHGNNEVVNGIYSSSPDGPREGSFSIWFGTEVRGYSSQGKHGMLLWYCEYLYVPLYY